VAPVFSFPAPLRKQNRFPSKELNSSDDIKRAIAENKEAIGYIEVEAIDASLKAVLVVP